MSFKEIIFTSGEEVEKEKVTIPAKWEALNFMGTEAGAITFMICQNCKFKNEFNCCLNSKSKFYCQMVKGFSGCNLFELREVDFVTTVRQGEAAINELCQKYYDSNRNLKEALGEIKTLREEIGKLTEERSGLHILVDMLRKEVSQWEIAEKAWEREEAGLTRQINELMEENMKIGEQVR